MFILRFGWITFYCLLYIKIVEEESDQKHLQFIVKQSLVYKKQHAIKPI